MSGLTIGKLAQLAGVAVETIRFYERKGLLENPPRTSSGYRVYPKTAVRRLRFIKRAQKLGFTLKEIRELLELRVHPDSTCEDVLSRTKAKICDIEERIRTLERMRESLRKLTLSCKGKGPLGDCPILEAMEDEAE